VASAVERELLRPLFGSWGQRQTSACQDAPVLPWLWAYSQWAPGNSAQRAVTLPPPYRKMTENKLAKLSKEQPE